MNKTTARGLLCLLLALGMLLLSGCSLLRDAFQKAVDDQAERNDLLIRMMKCVEEDDAWGAAALAYDQLKMKQDFPELVKRWPVHSTDPYEYRSTVNLHQRKSYGAPDILNVTSYLVHCEDGDYEVRVGTRIHPDDDRIALFDVARIEDLREAGIEPAGTVFPTARKTPVQWLLLIYWGLCAAFSLFTVVAVIRDRPRLYGLWIAGVLLFVGATGSIAPLNFAFNFRIFPLLPSFWLRYQGGQNRILFSVPLAAIVYWFLRGFLKKKSKKPCPAPEHQ